MSFKTTLFLFLAVVIAGIYIHFTERNRESIAERKTAARLAFRFDPEAVRNIRIETPSGVYVVERTNIQWRLTSPVLANADAGAIMRLLDTLSSLRKSEVITLEEQRTLNIDPANYGFTSPRVQIAIDDGHQTMSVLIGRDAPGGQQLYLKREDMPEIIVTSRDLLTVLPGSIMDLRDRRLFSGQPGRVVRIEWQHRDQILQASRNAEDQWSIDRPVQARGSGNTIRQWLDRIFESRVSEFVAESVAAGSLYGFDEPMIQVGIYLEGRAAPTVLKIGRAADAGEAIFYATLAGQDTVFTVDQEVVQTLKVNTADFRDRQLLPIPVMHINFIQLSDDQRILQLARNTQNVWEVIAPKRFVANDMKVQSILSSWSGVKINQFIDPPRFDSQLFAGGATRNAIRFARQMPANTTPALMVNTNGTFTAPDQDITYLLGPTNEANQLVVAAAGQIYAMEIAPSVMDTFSMNPLDFRDPLVLALSPAQVRRISQRVGQLEVAVEQTNAIFRGRSPSEIPDTQAIDLVLGTLSRLTAVRFIEEDPIDLQRYGLLDPTKQITIGVTGSTGINRVLFFGDRTGDDEVFAMLQGSDMVFTIAEPTMALLLKPVANSISAPSAIIMPENE